MSSKPGSLHVVGTGLIGGSAALAAARAGWRVTVEDTDEEAAAVIRDQLGREREVSGRGREDDVLPQAPAVVLVAVPPRLTASVVIGLLRRHVDATVTDTSSIKSQPLVDIEMAGGDRSRYVPGHPLAGSEQAGALAARGDLFAGRTWVLCDDAAGPARREAVAALVRDLEATPVLLSAATHDAALALTSHLPQVVGSALASVVGDELPRMDAPLEPSDLAGPALLDMTRVAGSPAELWATIAAANATNLGAAVRAVRAVLEDYERELAHGDAAVATAALVERGGLARRQLAAKHQGVSSPPGSPAAPRLGAFGQDDAWAWVEVAVPDAPGALAALFATAAGLGINIEDVLVDHAPHRATGLARLAVRADDADALRRAFAATKR